MLLGFHDSIAQRIDMQLSSSPIYIVAEAAKYYDILNTYMEIWH